MDRSKTQDEVRAEYVAKMGPELGELQYLLWHDVTTLHLQWSEYRELFATKPRRIDLMNETAPRFFGRLEALLWNDVLLHLYRLTDHPGGTGKERVTVLRYKPLVMGRPIQAAVHAAVDSATGATLFARDWRNHLIAHRDFSHARDWPLREQDARMTATFRLPNGTGCTCRIPRPWAASGYSDPGPRG